MMFKNFKKMVAAILALVFVMGFSTIASAASYDTSYSKYTEPTNSDYAYWSGSKVVKASGTTTKEIQWMQAAMNYCIKCGYIKGSYLTVDGSFGPASQTACKAFQKKAGLTQDGSFGPGTIDKMKAVLPTLKDPDKTTSSATTKTTTTTTTTTTKTTTSSTSVPSSSDYAYWNGSKVVKASGTTTAEIKWMQESLNGCISKGLKATKLTVDGSFGPASKTACAEFQKSEGLDPDGSFGPGTIEVMKKVLADANWKPYTKTKTPDTNNNSSSNFWLWPTTNHRISCGFADNIYHETAWHRGIDIYASIDSEVYASKSGTVALIGKNDYYRGNYIVIDHGDGFYSEYQHLKSVSVAKNGKVAQGQVIAKSGDTGVGTGPHLHFEIMNLGKTGLGSSYMSYYNTNGKFVNVNPKNSSSIYCSKSDTAFKISQASGSGIPTAKLKKSSTAAPASGTVYCSDAYGITYIFK